MSETIPTPESDAAFAEGGNDESDFVRMFRVLDFARTLERRLILAEREVARLKAGGCARDQTTTQFCAEAVALAKERDEVLKRVYSVDSIIEANRDAALEAVRQWREVAERLEAWIHALAPRVESHPHELVDAIAAFNRLARITTKGQP